MLRRVDWDDFEQRTGLALDREQFTYEEALTELGFDEKMLEELEKESLHERAIQALMKSPLHPDRPLAEELLARTTPEDVLGIRNGTKE